MLFSSTALPLSHSDRLSTLSIFLFEHQILFLLLHSLKKTWTHLLDSELIVAILVQVCGWVEDYMESILCVHCQQGPLTTSIPVLGTSVANVPSVHHPWVHITPKGMWKRLSHGFPWSTIPPQTSLCCVIHKQVPKYHSLALKPSVKDKRIYCSVLRVATLGVYLIDFYCVWGVLAVIISWRECSEMHRQEMWALLLGFCSSRTRGQYQPMA